MRGTWGHDKAAKLIARVQLEANDATFAALRDRLEQAHLYANWLSGQAWNAQAFGQFQIFKWFYKQAREQFPQLSSQTIVRSIAKASDSYKLDQKAKRDCRLNGSIAYDRRIPRWRWRTGRGRPLSPILFAIGSSGGNRV